MRAADQQAIETENLDEKSIGSYIIFRFCGFILQIPTIKIVFRGFSQAENQSIRSLTFSLLG